MRINITAPAKINLALDILGKRPDGYHVVNMVMQSVDLCDTVILTKTDSDGITLTCKNPNVPLNNTNIAYRAADKFFEYTGIKDRNINIKIRKKIPIAAGLAGGSSDGAAVLIGLNKLYSASLTNEQLCSIGGEIGADIPFCIMGGTMLAEGTGTILSPLPDMPECYFLIVKPPLSVSTAQAYSMFDEYGKRSEKSIDCIIDAICAKNLQIVSENLFNVFESVLDIIEVDIKPIKDIMSYYDAYGSCMSGSGPSVFAVFSSKNKAEKCAEKIKDEILGAEVFIASPINHGCIID